MDTNSCEQGLPIGSKLFFDGSRGIYIPKLFGECLRDNGHMTNLALLKDGPDCLSDLLAGPDCETYWDSWEYIMDNLLITENDRVYSLYHDGDLWLVPVA